MKRAVMVVGIVAVAVAAMAQYGDVPAYNAAPPGAKAKLAPILPKQTLWGPNFQYPFQVRAYEIAAKLDKVIYQQPCYCYCDRMGHNSLRSCYESTHAANCDACLKELYYAYFEHKKGRTAKQIRAGIIAGKWKTIDLEQSAKAAKVD